MIGAEGGGGGGGGVAFLFTQVVKLLDIFLYTVRTSNFFSAEAELKFNVLTFYFFYTSSLKHSACS